MWYPGTHDIPPPSGIIEELLKLGILNFPDIIDSKVFREAARNRRIALNMIYFNSSVQVGITPEFLGLRLITHGLTGTARPLTISLIDELSDNPSTMPLGGIEATFSIDSERKEIYKIEYRGYIESHFTTSNNGIVYASKSAWLKFLRAAINDLAGNAPFKRIHSMALQDDCWNN